MGKVLTKCKVCGNADINEIIIHYKELDSQRGVPRLGATRLSKFLYEYMHPERKRIRGAGYPHLIDGLAPIRIMKLHCDKCLRERHKTVKINPTRYGI